MTVNLSSVDSPPATMGPWIRDVAAALLQLDAKVNPTIAPPKTQQLVKATSLTNYTTFPDSAAGNGKVAAPLIPPYPNPTGPALVADNPAISTLLSAVPTDQMLAASSFPGGKRPLPSVASPSPYNSLVLIGPTTSDVNPKVIGGVALSPSPYLALGVAPDIDPVYLSPTYGQALGLNASAAEISADYIELRGQQIFNGNPVFKTMTSTASSSNVNYSASDGKLYYVTSTSATKKNVQNIDPEMIMKLRVVTFAALQDDTNRNHVGVIAEEVDALIPGKHPLVTYDGDGSVQSVEYDRFGVACIAKVQQLHARAVVLEQENVALRASLTASQSDIVTMQTSISTLQSQVAQLMQKAGM